MSEHPQPFHDASGGYESLPDNTPSDIPPEELEDIRTGFILWLNGDDFKDFLLKNFYNKRVNIRNIITGIFNERMLLQGYNNSKQLDKDLYTLLIKRLQELSDEGFMKSQGKGWVRILPHNSTTQPLGTSAPRNKKPSISAKPSPEKIEDSLEKAIRHAKLGTVWRFHRP